MRETAFSSAAWAKLWYWRIAGDASVQVLPDRSVRLQVAKPPSI
jgi:hypothetical protein